MFLRCHSRTKNGKPHRYWSVVESRRVAGGDVTLPTTNGREFVLPRYAEPTAEQAMILEQLNLALPPQPPPRIRGGQVELPAHGIPSTPPPPTHITSEL